jgi:hypothetical protein
MSDIGLKGCDVKGVQKCRANQQWCNAYGCVAPSMDVEHLTMRVSRTMSRTELEDQALLVSLLVTNEDLGSAHGKNQHCVVAQASNSAMEAAKLQVLQYGI